MGGGTYYTKVSSMLTTHNTCTANQTTIMIGSTTSEHTFYPHTQRRHSAQARVFPNEAERHVPTLRRNNQAQSLHH